MACFVDRDLIIEGVWDSQPENQSLPETEQHQAVLAQETEGDQVSPVGGADSPAQGKKITRKRSVWSKACGRAYLGVNAIFYVFTYFTRIYQYHVIDNS